MDISKEQIVEKVREILRDRDQLTKLEMETKYKEFMEAFPRLYLTTMDANSSEDVGVLISHLNYMLGVRENIIKGNKTPINANVIVSEHMAKKYVYPITGEPTTKQKEEALCKILAAENVKGNTSGYTTTKKS